MGAHDGAQSASGGAAARACGIAPPRRPALLAKELHCHAFASLAELAGNCEAVVICVSADEDLRAVIAGLDPGLSPRMIVMDCSTVAAGTAREMHAQLAAARRRISRLPGERRRRRRARGYARHHGGRR